MRTPRPALACLAAVTAAALAAAPSDELPDPKEADVVGSLSYWKNVPSKHLAQRRHVSIWLPPGYEKDESRRYPVLYAHDGQNLFDPRLSFTKVDWGVDEAIAAGIKDGTIDPPIVVGIWNTPDRRREYCPWDLGPEYAKFIIEELMPEVNRHFRTRVGSGSTGTMGSSMGGLISFWLCWKHPDRFGLGACVSTHFPFSAVNLAKAQGKDPAPGTPETPLILADIAGGARFNADPRPRLWFDYGTVNLDASYEPVQKQVDAWLERSGMKPGTDFVSRKYEGADHNEAAWRSRVGDALKFLFPGKMAAGKKEGPSRKLR